MQIKELYRYKREDGGINVSPIKPEGDYTTLYRLIADEGKALAKDGENLCAVIDTDSTDGWYEVDAVEEEAVEETVEETE